MDTSEDHTEHAAAFVAGEPAQPRPSAFLEWQRGDGQRSVLALTTWGSDRVVIGRDPSCDVSLPHDERVSRLHALVEFVSSCWTIADDGLSRNGTWVNGAKLFGRRRLADGDAIVVGETRLAFRTPPAAASRPTQATAPTINALADTVSPTQRRVLIALCRPLEAGTSATPAPNRQIAAELVLSVGAVKAHLRALSERFGLGDLGQNEKRNQLAQLALERGIVGPKDFSAPR